MAFTKLEIMQYASILLGNRSFVSIPTSGDLGNAIELCYSMVLKSALSQDWRFTTKIQQLNLLPGFFPKEKYQWHLQLPSDYLSAWSVRPLQDYMIYGTELWAHDKIVYLEYRSQVDESKFPDYFARYMSFAVAADLGFPVAKDAGIINALQKQAMFELQRALFIDSQSHPTPAIDSNPLIEVRTYGAPDSVVPNAQA